MGVSGAAFLPCAASRERFALLVLLLVLVVIVALTATPMMAVTTAALAVAALTLESAAPPERFFAGLPGAAPPYVALAPPAPPRPYPGAFYEEALGGLDEDTAYGFRDRLEGDGTPPGNRFNDSRTYAPDAQAPCFDDEADDAEIDGDERMAYSGLSRNDPTRVVAGTMNRLEFLRPILSEEVAEMEDREWWGRGEQ